MPSNPKRRAKSPPSATPIPAPIDAPIPPPNPKTFPPKTSPPQADQPRAPHTHPRRLHGKIWVEADGQLALTDAGADLLEQISICGSLSEAARRLHFSYRRAWMLMDAMNKRWPAPLVETAIGGVHGGGTTVTDLGRHVLGVYRNLQVQLEHLLDGAADAFSTTV